MEEKAPACLHPLLWPKETRGCSTSCKPITGGCQLPHPPATGEDTQRILLWVRQAQEENRAWEGRTTSYSGWNLLSNHLRKFR